MKREAEFMGEHSSNTTSEAIRLAIERARDQKQTIILRKRKVFSDTAISLPINGSAIVEKINLLKERKEVEESLTYIRQAITQSDKANDNTIIQSIIDSGGIFHLIEQLDAKHSSRIRSDASCILTNIASGTHDQANSLIEKGIILKTQEIITKESEEDEIVESLVWLLGNLSADNIKNRDMVLMVGLNNQFTRFLKFKKTKIQQIASWTMYILASMRPAPNYSSFMTYMDDICKVLISLSDGVVIQNVIGVLAFISEGYLEEKAKWLSNNKLIEFIVAKSRDEELKMNCLRILGNLCGYTINEKSLAINCGVLKIVQEDIQSPKEKVRFECCWIIANLLLGKDYHIQAVIDNKFIDLLFADVVINMPVALWALSNMTQNCNQFQLHYLLEKGYFQRANEVLLNHQKYKIELVISVIVSLKHMLNSSYTNKDEELFNAFTTLGIIESMEALQTHPNNKVYQAALEFMDLFIEHNK